MPTARSPAITIPFLTAEWRDLVIANFEVDPAVLASRVPAGTELELYRGRALASLVAFRFADTRVLGFGVPGHRDFDEVNLRFYVRRRDDKGAWRRGVTFVKELVPRRAIAAVARRVYHEPYEAVPMRHELVRGPGPDAHLVSASYQWRLGGRWHSISAEVSGRPIVPPPDSEAAFTIEHYWGYTRQGDGSTKEYQVRHDPWRVWSARKSAIDLDAALVYGEAWAPCLGASPTAVIVAEGSEITVFSGRRLSIEPPST